MKNNEPTLKAKDKIVLKITRDGAIEENLTTGETERISKRIRDAELVRKAESPTLEPKKNRKHKQRYSRKEEKAAVESTSAAVFDENMSYPAPAEQTEKPDEVAEVADTPAPLPQENPVKEHTPSRKVEMLERRAEKAHQRLDRAYEKLPKKKVAKSERVFDEEKGKAHKRLYFDEEIKEQKPPSRLRFEAKKVVTQAGGALVYKAHGKVHEVEQENSAVEAAHRSELLAESASRHIHFDRQSKTPYEKYSKLEHEAENADSRLHFERTVEEHPEMRNKRDMNKFYQKARNKNTAKQAKEGYDAAEDSAERIKATAEKAAEKLKEFVEKNKVVFMWIGAGFLIIILCSALFASCTAMLSSSGSMTFTTSYLSEDEDMTGAEDYYKALEEALKSEIDGYESTHSYDEYIFNLDEIYHDPYVLISLLSAMNDGAFELSDVKDFLSTLFETQYALTEEVTVETRYRTETQTEWRLYIDPYTCQPVYNPYTGEYLTYPVEVEVQVPYDYYICTVTLTSADLDYIARELLDDEQLLLYEAYMENKGNREDLFD